MEDESSRGSKHIAASITLVAVLILYLHVFVDVSDAELRPVPGASPPFLYALKHDPYSVLGIVLLSVVITFAIPAAIAIYGRWYKNWPQP